MDVSPNRGWRWMVQREIIQGLILTIEVAWVALGRYFSNKWGQNRRLPVTPLDRSALERGWPVQLRIDAYTSESDIEAQAVKQLQVERVQLCHFRFRRLHKPFRRKLTIHARLIDGVCRDCGQRNRGFRPNRRFRLQPWFWIRHG